MEATRELARESWSEYLEGLSDDLLHQPVSIEIIDPLSSHVVEASRLALELLTYDRRNDVFEVAAARGGPKGPSVLRHLIDRPTRIEVDSWTSLAPTTIMIDGEDGIRTVIRVCHEGAFAG